MRKVLSLVLILLFGLSLTGCFNLYYDSSRRDMELVDVKVFDKDNNEIEGTYENFFGYRSPKFKSNDSEQLNSAAPVFNFYVVKAEEGETYTVKYYLESQKNNKLTKLVFTPDENVYNETKYEVTDIVKEDGKYIATMTINGLSELNNFYYISYWYSGDNKYSFGQKGSNKYIKGVYLELPTKEETRWIY